MQGLFCRGEGRERHAGERSGSQRQGFEEVAAVSGPYGISFVEILGTGVVQSTTISKANKAVHSRHTIIAREFVPSQYYGQCRVVRGASLPK
jgi:hypothetical protein